MTPKAPRPPPRAAELTDIFDRMGVDTMAKERKLHTSYEYCDRAIDWLCSIEDENHGIPENVACEVLKAAQLMRIADKLHEIDEKLDECATHLCGLSIDGIKAYIYGD